MATIRERKTATGARRYTVRIRVKGRPAATATFERKTDAREWAQRTEADLRRGILLPELAAKGRTFGELVDSYLAHRRTTRADERHRRPHLEWWRERLGDFALADVTPARIAQLRDALLAGDTLSGRAAGPAAANRYLATLSHCFSYAVRELEWLPSNPCARVTRPAEPRGRVRYLDRERELPALLAACREASDRRLYPLVVLALSTGARQGELLALKWADVDGERGVAVLHETKNGERRGLALSRPALDALAELRRVRSLASPYVFGTPRTGDALPTFGAGLRDAFEAALRAAGIANFHFHDLRHTAASYLAMSGASLAEIAEVLGHRTLSMVKRYSHLAPDHVRGVVSRMADNFLAGAVDGGAQ